MLTIFPGGHKTGHLLKVKYFRLISEPVRNQDPLPILKKYSWGVLFMAKAMMLADHNAESGRTAYWERKGEQAFRWARADDINRWDENTHGFIPYDVHGTHSDRSLETYWEEGY
jgi:hypothetical protein